MIDLQSEFTFGAHSLCLERNITYHGQLDKMEQLLWPDIVGHVASVVDASALKKDEVNFFGLGEQLASQDAFFAELRKSAGDALVPLGYSGERITRVVQKWLDECAEKALRGLVDPSIYGVDRYCWMPFLSPRPA